MFRPHYYSKNHKPLDLFALEADSIELHLPTYDPKIDDPIHQQVKKEKLPSHRFMKIFKGPKTALVHHHLYQSWEVTEPTIHCEEIITTTTSTYQQIYWVVLPTFAMMTCSPFSDEMPKSYPQILERKLILKRSKEEKVLADGRKNVPMMPCMFHILTHHQDKDCPYKILTLMSSSTLSDHLHHQTINKLFLPQNKEQTK